MPLIKSAKKRVRVAARKAQINQLHRSGAKTAVRSATRGIQAKAGDAANLTQQASSRLDRAVSKGAIHKNKAARTKSRLAKKLQAAGIAAAVTAVKKAAPKAKAAAKPAAKKPAAKKAAM